MVKGVSRRVVVVRPDDYGMFEQAIFLMRDYSVPRSDAVREACKIANRYLAGRKTSCRRRFSGWLVGAAFAAGTGVASMVWAVAVLLC